MPTRRRSSLGGKGPCFLQNIPEVKDPVTINIQGKLPDWFHGTLIYPGPSLFDLERGSVHHWMDAFASIVKCTIKGNTLQYSSRLVSSTSLKKAQKAKKPILPGFVTPAGYDDNRGFFSRIPRPFTIGDMTDNCISVVNYMDSKLYVSGEAATVFEIEPKTLDTYEGWNTNKDYGLNSICPKIFTDANTGVKYIIGLKVNPTFTYVILQRPPSNASKPPSEKFQVLGNIPARFKFGPAGLRFCFMMTENYLMLLEGCGVANLLKAAGTWLKGYSMMDWVDWLPNEKVRIVLLHKSSGKILKTEYLTAEGFCFTSFINAYEEKDRIIIDLSSQPSLIPYVISYKTDQMRGLSPVDTYCPSTMDRYVVPIVADPNIFPEQSDLLGGNSRAEAIKKGNKVILSPVRLSRTWRGFDNVLINPNFNGKKHSIVYICVAYPTNVGRMSKLAGGIGKYYVKKRNKRIQFWRSDEFTHVWNPVFVPDPKDDSEDAGILVAMVSNLKKRNSDFLVFLDAKYLTEIGRAIFPFPVPSYFEATFIPEIM